MWEYFPSFRGSFQDNCRALVRFVWSDDLVDALLQNSTLMLLRSGCLVVWEFDLVFAVYFNKVWTGTEGITLDS